MLVIVSKNFTEVPPIFFPDKSLIIIAYSKTVEVHDIDHNVIWKIEEKHKVIKLEILNDNEFKFYLALHNGDLKLCDINTKSITDVMAINCELLNLFISHEAVITIEHDSINFYKNFDINQKKQISPKRLKHIAFAGKTGILAMVENDILSVTNTTDDKSITHTLTKHKKTTVFSAVTCHPTESTVATADSTGQIQIWWNVLQPTKTTTIFHWHFLSLPALSFSADGTHLLSGGREQVLVKWKVSITDGDHRKTFLPRLEAEIKNVASFCGSVGERYLLTMADNSLQIVDSATRSVHAFAGLVQRSAVLHEKVEKHCPLSPVGVASAHAFGGKLGCSVLLNGHEGKLQFFDLKKRTTVHQLDVACQNWPTETENYLVPGFIQVQAVAVSGCGTRIAAYQGLGVPNDPYDFQRSIRIFEWNAEAENFNLEYDFCADNLSKVSDMVFHPSKPDNLVLLTTSCDLWLLTRRKNGDTPAWVINHTIILDEELFRLKVHPKLPANHTAPLLASCGDNGHKTTSAALLVTRGDCLLMYPWHHLLHCHTRPVLAVNTHTLATEICTNTDGSGEPLSELCGAITAAAISGSATVSGRHRLVLGLREGIIVVETQLRPDWSLEMKSVVNAVSKNAVKALAVCPITTEVAVMFEGVNPLTVFPLWDAGIGNTRSLPVATVMEGIAWVPAADSGRCALVGLQVENAERSIVFLEAGAELMFQEDGRGAEGRPTEQGRNLLALADDADVDMAETPTKAFRHRRGRLDRSFLDYDAKSAPSAAMILSALYSVNK